MSHVLFSGCEYSPSALVGQFIVNMDFDTMTRWHQYPVPSACRLIAWFHVKFLSVAHVFMALSSLSRLSLTWQLDGSYLVNPPRFISPVRLCLEQPASFPLWDTSLQHWVAPVSRFPFFLAVEKVNYIWPILRRLGKAPWEREKNKLLGSFLSHFCILKHMFTVEN